MSTEKENRGAADKHEEHGKNSSHASHQGAGDDQEAYHPHHDPEHTVHYSDGKDPRRVEAGKKAAETRHKHEEEARKHQEEEAHRHEVRVEAGRKSWETRRQHEEESRHRAEAAHEKEGAHNESHHEKDPTRVQAGKKAAAHFDHEHFVELGHKGADARWHGHAEERDGEDNGKQETHSEGHQQHEKDPVRVEAGKKAASHFDHQHFVELGHKGADARWHGQAEEDDGGDAREKQGTPSESHQQHEKDPVRVEAGKKAASHFDHEHFVELGHMGADARWHGHEKQGQEHGAGDANGKQETHSESHQHHEKDPIRVEAGKKAAAHFDHEHFVEMGRKSGEVRREHAAEHEHEKDPVRVEAGKKAAAHFDHEHFVELGHMGAEARYGKHHHDGESPVADPKAKNARVEDVNEADDSNAAEQEKK